MTAGGGDAVGQFPLGPVCSQIWRRRNESVSALGRRRRWRNHCFPVRRCNQAGFHLRPRRAHSGPLTLLPSPNGTRQTMPLARGSEHEEITAEHGGVPEGSRAGGGNDRLETISFLSMICSRKNRFRAPTSKWTETCAAGAGQVAGRFTGVSKKVGCRAPTYRQAPKAGCSKKKDASRIRTRQVAVTGGNRRFRGHHPKLPFAKAPGHPRRRRPCDLTGRCCPVLA